MILRTNTGSTLEEAQGDDKGGLTETHDVDLSFTIPESIIEPPFAHPPTSLSLNNELLYIDMLCDHKNS